VESLPLTAPATSHVGCGIADELETELETCEVDDVRLRLGGAIVEEITIEELETLALGVMDDVISKHLSS
jgi:hypothetical protein